MIAYDQKKTPYGKICVWFSFLSRHHFPILAIDFSTISNWLLKQTFIVYFWLVIKNVYLDLDEMMQSLA